MRTGEEVRDSTAYRVPSWERNPRIDSPNLPSPYRMSAPPPRRAPRPEILLRDGRHDPAVGEPRVPRMGAHPVHRQFPRPRGGGHHLSPGAHAEGVDPAPGGGARRQAVVGDGETGAPRRLPVLDP